MAETSPRSAGIRTVRLAAAAALLIPAALLTFAGFAKFQNLDKLADERIVRSLDVEQEHATKSFQIVSLILEDAIEELIEAPYEGREQHFHDLFQKRIRTVSEIQSIWFYDKDGYPVATSSAFPAPRQRSFADQDYFRAHVEKDSGTYYGEVHNSTFGNQPFFTMSRRVTRNGEFIGVLEVSVLPSDFYRFYHQLVYGEGLQYALLREDGTFLVRFPVPEEPPQPLGPSTGFRKMIGASKQGGFYWTTSPVDKIERRFGVRRLASAPVYVSAGVASTTIRAEWVTEMFPYFFFGIIGSLFLFASLLYVLRTLQRLHAEMHRREVAEGALRQSQRLDAIGQLTGGVAHDFNNLLTIIIGNLAAADRQVAAISDAAKEKLGTSIKRAMQGAQRAATLTKRLLAFSRQQPLSPKALDLNKLLLNLPDLLRGGLGESVARRAYGRSKPMRPNSKPRFSISLSTPATPCRTAAS
jgi:two-component system NtrC family sensor kinase